MSARDEVLARVRDAIAPTPAPAPDLPREYRTRTDDVETFIARLHHYQAQTQHIPEGKLGQTVGATLRKRHARRVVTPEGIPQDWLAGLEPMRDTPPLDPHTLDSADAVVTTCAVAIAQNRDNCARRQCRHGRRALSLVPDYHLCVVRTGQIVGSVPEAIATLDPLSGRSPSSRVRRQPSISRWCASPACTDRVASRSSSPASQKGELM
jgi:L-lactate dehydrogenase complex protein LldG